MLCLARVCNNKNIVRNIKMTDFGGKPITLLSARQAQCVGLVAKFCRQYHQTMDVWWPKKVPNKKCYKYSGPRTRKMLVPSNIICDEHVLNLYIPPANKVKHCNDMNFAFVISFLFYSPQKSQTFSNLQLQPWLLLSRNPDLKTWDKRYQFTEVDNLVPRLVLRQMLSRLHTYVHRLFILVRYSVELQC